MLYNRGFQAFLAKDHNHYCQQRNVIESSALFDGYRQVHFTFQLTRPPDQDSPLVIVV